MGKKEKLPRGCIRLPEWWVEVVPHDTLFLAEDEAKRKADQEEALKFARLAAEQDLLQKYGGEGFPNWNPATDGPRTKEEEDEWVSKGYKRNEKEEWINEAGEPLEGRQFNGQMPPGYLPGYYGGESDTNGLGGPGNLSSAKYERDKDMNWEKPDWMKVKLRSTGKKGDDPDKSIVKGDGKVYNPAKGGGAEEDGDGDGEAAAQEESSEGEGKDYGEIRSAAEIKPRATGELQAILNKRKQASD